MDSSYLFLRPYDDQVSVHSRQAASELRSGSEQCIMIRVVQPWPALNPFDDEKQNL
jgi:hypothetical protein